MGKAKQASKTSNVDKSARTADNKKRRAARIRRKADALAERAARFGSHKGETHKTYKNRIRRMLQRERASAAKCASWRQYQAKRAPRFSSTVEVVKPSIVDKVTDLAIALASDQLAVGA